MQSDRSKRYTVGVGVTVSMLTVWDLWFAQAVPSRTCIHGGSVAALDVPKVCQTVLTSALTVSSRPFFVDVPFTRSEGRVFV